MASDKSLARAQFAHALLGFGTIRMFLRGARSATGVLQAHGPTAGPSSESADRFVQLVRREVRRAMRTKCDLSLALFSFDGETADATGLMNSITACVERNMRETDACAILGNGFVAVLLPETNFQGGSTYSERILHELPQLGMTADVQSYPSAVFDELRSGRLGTRPIAEDEVCQEALQTSAQRLRN